MLLSYALEDFIPFTRDTYLRLLARVNEDLWPWQAALLLLGLGLVALCWFERRRAACLLTAALSAWVGYWFLGHYYAQLNWAAGYFAWAFYGQAALLALLAAWKGEAPPPGQRAVGAVAALLCLMWPLAGLWPGVQLATVEVLGLHADITSAFLLALGIGLFRGGRLWLVLLIPASWCLLSALTCSVLELRRGYWLWGMLIVVLAVLLKDGLRLRAAGR